MTGLQMLGVLLLVAMALGIGFYAYAVLRSASTDAAARSAVIEAANACQTVITAGGRRSVQIFIPEGYAMMLSENLVRVDGFTAPEGGLAMRFAENFTIDSGSRVLTVWSENGMLVVEWT
jgi:hypothetical protein